MKVILLLLAIGSISFQPPDAHAGFCAGNGARIRSLFERLTYWTDQNVGNALGQFRHAGQKIAQYLPYFSLWLLHVNSRGALASLLKQTAAAPENLSSVKNLATALEPLWNLAADINQHISKARIDTKLSLEHITKEIVISWATCQAIKTVRSEPCNLLEPLGEKYKFDCVGMLVRFGILYTGRCSEDNVELAAGVMQISPENAGELCQVLKKKQGDQCGSVASSTQVAQMCLALTGQGEAACKLPQLSERDSKECLDDLYAYQATTGALSLESWERQGDPNIMSKAAVYSFLDSGDCLEMALRLYDKFDQFGADLFFLENRPWYHPPGIH